MDRLQGLIREVARLRMDVRKSMEAALRDGEFQQVAAIAVLADQLEQISILQNGNAVVGVQAATSAEARTKRPACTAAERASDKSEKGDSYPRFLVSDGDLIKVGWSPKSQDEYRHRVDAGSVKRVIAMIQDAARKNRMFKVTDVSAKADEIPSYQIHTILAWLRNCGLVAHHGRRGYTLAKPAQFGSEVMTAMALLPSEN